MIIEFYRQIFEDYSYRTSRNSVQWEPYCAMRAGGRTDKQTEYGQTDRHGEANGRFPQLCTSASQLLHIILMIVFIILKNFTA
jgi:hypothetical protein